MSFSAEVPNSPVIALEPLFVDLDGTLIAGDVTWESLFAAVGKFPWLVFVIPFWFLQGRGYMKRRVAEHAAIEVRGLPYHPQVVDFCRRRRAQGGEVILATASDRSLARAVAENLGVFTGYFGTDGAKNLKGAAKLARIEEYCRERGATDFSYVGDAWADVPIWKHCRHVYAVAPPAALVAALNRAGTAPPEILVQRRPLGASLLDALRPQLWVKNLLLGVPLVLFGGVIDGAQIISLLWAMAAVSACASAIYLIHDLMNLSDDRRLPMGQRRPLAAGTFPVPYAPPLVIGLLVLSFGIALSVLPLSFTALLAIYFSAGCIYATRLGRIPLVEGLLLPGMLMLRVWAGGCAVGVPAPASALAACLLIFVAVAFVGRFSPFVRAA